MLQNFIKCYICIPKQKLHQIDYTLSFNWTFSLLKHELLLFQWDFSFDSLIIYFHRSINIWFALQEHQKKEQKRCKRRKKRLGFQCIKRKFFISSQRKYCCLLRLFSSYAHMVTIFFLKMRLTKSSTVFVCSQCIKMWCDCFQCELQSMLKPFE